MFHCVNPPLITLKCNVCSLFIGLLLSLGKCDQSGHLIALSGVYCELPS
jgi:hypothetical protein